MKNCIALDEEILHPRLKRPIKVLCVIPTNPFTRCPMVFARRQASGLRDAGIDCESFYFQPGLSPQLLLTQLRNFHQVIRSFHPDIVHAQYGTITALFSLFSCGVPVVVTFRGSDLNPDPSVRVWIVRRLISELAAVAAESIICVSEQLKETLWWGSNRAVVIPTGVDTNLFYPQPQAEIRAQLGWDARELIVLFNAGGNPRIKRLDIAQAAVQVARQLIGNIRLLVLNGDVAPDFVPLLMCGADCLLLTSDWEGSPTVVQEAIACNLPVVTVDVGDVRLRLAGVQPSRIVDRNVAQIGKALAEILLDNHCSNGYARVGQFSNTTVIRETIDVYRAVLKSTTEDSVNLLADEEQRSASMMNK